MFPVAPAPLAAAPGQGQQVDDPQRVLDAFQLSRAVKLFAIVDGVFLLIWSFQIWYLALGVVLAICGYYGATHYRAPYVYMYVLYLLLSIAYRLYWMSRGQNAITTLVVVLGIVIEFYILNITLKLIGVLKRLTDNERTELAAINHVNMGGPANAMDPVQRV